jgi:hypothetical protein
VQPTIHNLTEAFTILANTVNDFCLRGRPCLGATLKPKLFDRGVDEKALRFPKFVDFLRAAEREGYVRLGRSAGGDIEVRPTTEVVRPTVSPDVAPQLALFPPPLVATPSVPVRVRADLWSAFNSHSDQWVYDPVEDRAFRSDAPSSSMVPVPSGASRIAGWMRSFAEQQEPTAKAALTSAVDRGSDMYEFTIIARNLGIQRLWRRFHIQQVVTSIEAWATEHGLQPREVTTPFHAPVVHRLLPPTVPEAQPTASSPTTTAYLHAKLAPVVDRLIDDLITLRGLLAVVETKQS